MALVGALSLAVVNVVLFATPAGSSTAVTAGYRDFSYSGASAPTGQKPQSKLWFNDGSWWGDLYNSSSKRYEIYRFDVASQSWTTTGVVLDTRKTTQADTLWDGQHLYILTAQKEGNTSSDKRVLFWRLSYTSSTGKYALDAGFPINITTRAPEAAVFDKDSNGTLWVTFTDTNGTTGRTVYVAHSLANDLQWTLPYILPVPGSTNLSADDISTLVSYGNSSGRHVGVLYSNQADETLNFAVHEDGSPDTTWTRTVVTGGPKIPDDHLNIKSLLSDDSGRVFAIVKTSLNDKSPSNPNDPLIVLWTLSGNGTWTSATVWKVRENATRAIVLLDSEHRQLYAFSASPCCSGGTIYMKSTSYDAPSFADGFGTPFIQSGTDLTINNPTSTKQELSSVTGLLVEAGDDHSLNYLHGWLPLGGSPPPPTTTTTTIVPTTTTTTVPTTTTTTTTPGGGTTATLSAVADTYVDSANATTAFGGATTLRADASPAQRSYLRFDLGAYAGRTLVSARLEVTTTTTSSSGSPGPVVVKSVADNSWVEAATTWNTAPVTGATIGSVSSPTLSGTTYTIPLATASVTLGGLASFAVDTTSSDAFYVNSREAPVAPPRLVLVLA